MSYCHIHAPSVTNKAIVAKHCPDCKSRTRMIMFFVPWYGWDSTCIKCGRHYDDLEWTELDFVRGSRQKSIDRAKKRWRETVMVPDEMFIEPKTEGANG